ncbi:hypothetical protein VNI00_003060 [Paramarasmius palmivorus]|uniref:P-loop containing nucleoside triphosphate hydrolase protein n=1 Tax=Paramarasmius palmivorus TaxID=297713 RepID=A0AAW0DV47_9AGAR
MSVPDLARTTPESQITMGLGFLVNEHWNPWDNANIPAYASALSFTALVVTSCYKRAKETKHAEDRDAQEVPSISTRIHPLQRLQAGMCIALLSLTFLTRSITPVPMIATFTYVAIFSVLALITPTYTRDICAHHLNAVLTVSLLVYTYRDLFPLATLHLRPQDEHEGALLWWKIGVLGLATLLPLVIPRQYKPINPKKPYATPHPEQTASLLSLICFSFMDPTVSLASRVSHMSVDQMPPLADYDAAEHLREKSTSHVASFSRGPQIQRHHVFWSILHLVRRDYTNMVIMVVIQTIGKFIVPVSVNQLLRYLEGSKNEFFIQARPWFWVLMIFVGPNLAALSMERYMLLALRSLTQINSILIQIIFSHALRIRMKAQAPPVRNSQNPTLGEQQATLKNAQKSSWLEGKINNLVTTDLNNILNGPHLPYLVAYVPLQLLFSVIFLYSILGWSAFVAFGCTILLLPVPGYFASFTHKIQAEKMKRTDERVEVVTETMKVLRMVKFFGWENKMSSLIAEKREQELKWIKKYWRLRLVIQIVKTQCTFIVGLLGRLITSKVSLDRINEFLVETEVLDTFSPDHSDQNVYSTISSSEIGVHEALFTWSKETFDDPHANQARFVLSVEGTLKFKRGCLNLIVGPTGSGKTSLLMALLGELHFIPLKPDSYVSLPRAGGLAYAAQESWVQNDTIRDNILFGSTYEEERYQKVIYQCGLEKDLALFDAGDQTEVGEKGVTLSGGQKARVTLARAVYSPAEILVLDDVLAALEADSMIAPPSVHTAKWIVEKCLRGDLLKGRTVILVTHNLPLTVPLAEVVISVKDGKVTSGGAIDNILNQDTPTNEDEETKSTEKEDILIFSDDKKSKADGKLIVAEEVQMGRVGFSPVKLYLNAFGGSHAVFALTIYVGSLMVSGALNVAQTWYLGYWATQYELMPPSEVPVLRNFGIYGLLLLMALIALGITYTYFSYSAVRAARTIHKKLLSSVLNTTLRWLDMTPVSRILTRCTADIDAVDMLIPSTTYDFGILVTKMITQLGALAIYTPVFIVPGVVIALVGNWLRNKYITAVMCTRRELSKAQAPVLAQFETAIAGIVSIRAYGASDVFEQELRRRIDVYTRVGRTNSNLGRWLASRVELLGALFSCGLAAYLVYYSGAGASGAGFSLNMAVTFSGAIIYVLFSVNDLEMKANSLERIEGYLDIEQEPMPTKEHETPAYWPVSGDLRAEHLSARYSPEGPQVLHDLNFHIRSGERVGVVGRTGSGKSSLTLSLLRCIPTEGDVYYDGLKTSNINLDALRSKITIIPQMPELLSGSLRQNLDPFGQYDDATLNDVLRSAGLFELQKTKHEGRITLDTGISSGGTNLSVGQRQIIALARAILRKSKVLILDEATSAIDYETDSIIQQSLRNELGGDTTVITIAHRLQTIMDADRIMVLDAGNIVEFDTPKELLRKEGGLLRVLVNESADSDVLLAMAEGKSRE